MFRETGKFEAKGSDGMTYTVLEFSDVIEGSSNISGQPPRVAGDKGYRLSPQQTRVHLEDGKFVISGTTIVLTPVQPRPSR